MFISISYVCICVQYHQANGHTRLSTALVKCACHLVSEKSKIYRLILCNVFFKMTHVLPLISAQNCDKNALQNRHGRPVLNKIGSLTIVFSVFSFAEICQCTKFLPHRIYKSIKDITMNFGSLIANSLIYCMKLQ